MASIQQAPTNPLVATNKKKPKFCVGDKVLVSYYEEALEGYIHFHGPVDCGQSGFKEFYGIELGPSEGESDGQYLESASNSKSNDRKYFFPTKPKSAVFVTQKNITSIIRAINGQRLTLNDRVLVKGRSNGTIKFIGPTLFGPHIWYGVELDVKLGRNNGMVRGVRYFECKNQHGVFVREEKLVPIDKQGNPKNMVNRYKRKTPPEMAADLFAACSSGDIKTVRAILTVDKTVAKIARDHNSDATALMTACYHGYYQIVQELLHTRKIDVNEQNYHGLSALHMAAQAGHANIVDLLLKQDIDVDLRAEDGITALYCAVEKGHEDVVEKLLATFADVNLANRDNETPLMQSCHRGYDKIVARLMRASNININQKRKSDGATALFIACRESSVNV